MFVRQAARLARVVAPRVRHRCPHAPPCASRSATRLSPGPDTAPAPCRYASGAITLTTQARTPPRHSPTSRGEESSRNRPTAVRDDVVARGLCAAAVAHLAADVRHGAAGRQHTRLVGRQSGRGDPPCGAESPLIRVFLPLTMRPNAGEGRAPAWLCH